ncbi:MAG: hypothetical protein KF814_16045 [Nitrospiraceae bacterium]|nr:hypothetical protein [Nitrospiraceae bacterium]
MNADEIREDLDMLEGYKHMPDQNKIRYAPDDNLLSLLRSQDKGSPLYIAADVELRQRADLNNAYRSYLAIFISVASLAVSVFSLLFK